MTQAALESVEKYRKEVVELGSVFKAVFHVAQNGVSFSPTLIGSKCCFLLLMTFYFCRDPAERLSERNTDHFALSNSWGRGLRDAGVSTSLCFCFTLV